MLKRNFTRRNFLWVFWDRPGLLLFSDEEGKQSLLHCIFNCKLLSLERAANYFSALRRHLNNILRRQNKKKEKLTHNPSPQRIKLFFIWAEVRVSEISLGKDKSGQWRFTQMQLGLFYLIQKMGMLAHPAFLLATALFTEKNLILSACIT